VRHLKLGRVTALELLAQVLTLIIGVPLALWWGNVWALVASLLISNLIRTVASHLWLEGPRNRFAWDKAAVDEMLSFGRWSLVATTFYFLCVRWDAFALGKLEGLAVLGVYNLAILIVSVPEKIGERITGSVVTPVLANRYRDSTERFGAALKNALGIILPVVGALYLGAAFTAPAFFHVAYRADYHGAGWMTQLALVVSWTVFVQECTSRALLALGDARALAVINLARLLVLVPVTLVLFTPFGLVGFLVGSMIASLAGTVMCLVLLRTRQLHVAFVTLRNLAGITALGLLGAGLPAWLSLRVEVASHWLTLASVPLVFAPVALVAVRRARHAMRAGL
jgi:O-antigen/teichoic acid export membrane protein